jgi:HlyD family secretion protein
VTAPADGQIVKIHYEQGESINAGSLLIELQDRQNMLLKVPFLTTEASQLQPGQTAEVIMQSTGERFSGTITEISSVQQVGAGGTLTHEVSILVQNPGGLTEGVFATAEAGGFVCAGSGTFEYRHSENIMAEVNGDLAELYVKEGDIVSKGQSLLRISSTQVETNLRNAQLSLDNAQASLDEYTITSPIAGTVIEKKFEQGDTIDSNNSASEMAVIYDMSQLEFTMNIDELDIGKLQVGQKVQITCDALEGEQFEGYVSKISINGKSNNGVTTYPVTVKLDDYGNLLPGMNINATVMLQQAENVLTVPAGAVQRGNLVLVQGTESTVEPPAGQTTPEGYVWREVEIGANDDSYIEIISGLEEGDMIAVPANAMDSGGFGGPGGPGGEVVVTVG